MRVSLFPSAFLYLSRAIVRRSLYRVLVVMKVSIPSKHRRRTPVVDDGTTRVSLREACGVLVLRKLHDHWTSREWRRGASERELNG
jgi:hypothetical protein